MFNAVCGFVKDTAIATYGVCKRTVHAVATAPAVAKVAAIGAGYWAWASQKAQVAAFSFTDVVTIDGVTGEIEFGVTAIVASVVVVIVGIFAGLGILKMTSAALTWGLNKFSRGTKSA